MKLRISMYITLMAAGFLLWFPGRVIAVDDCFMIDLDQSDRQHPTLRFDGQTGAYYQIITADSLRADHWTVAGMALGRGKRQQWQLAPLAPEQQSVFYRLLSIPQHMPHDADADGMDDVFELRNAGLNPLDQSDADGDFDGDGLCNREEYAYRTDINEVDSDRDGADDGYEIREYMDPASSAYQSEQSLINNNWLYHSGREVDPFIERLPNFGTCFASIDYETGMACFHILTSPEIVLSTNASANVNLLVRYEDPETMEEIRTEYPAEFITNVLLSSETPFHGLPTMGETMLDVYRVECQLPDKTGKGSVAYIPFVRAQSSDKDSTEDTYLVYSNPYDTPCQQHFRNNWFSPHQWLDPHASIGYNLRCPLLQLENAGFESSGSASDPIPAWVSWYEDPNHTFIQSDISYEGEQSVCMTVSGNGLYQDVGITPGNELVVKARIYPVTEPDQNPNENSGSFCIQYRNNGGEICSEPFCFPGIPTANQWNDMVFTSRVPEGTRSARILINKEGMEDGRQLLFDSIEVGLSDDSDKDGIPDWWEEQYGNDPDDPSDVLSDNDGDLLAAIDEYRSNTDASSPDSDGDGILDGEELLFGFDPNNSEDVTQDSDDDGISNLEEIQQGTNPHSSDSDNDGIPDWIEQNIFSTDPLADNSPSLLVDTITLNANDTSTSVGSWQTNGTSVASAGLRGILRYAVSLAQAEIYNLRIYGADNRSHRGERSFDLRISVDGLFIGKTVLTSHNGESSFANILLPWMTDGEHEIEVLWDNMTGGESVRIDQLSLQAFIDGDSDGDGRKDWVETYLSHICAVEKCAVRSVFSPVCIEGKAHYPELITIDDTAGPFPLPGGRWYADFPLPEDGTETNCLIAYQNGAYDQRECIQWVPCNLADLDLDAVVPVRTGDSMKMTIQPEGTTGGRLEVFINGEEVYNGAADTPFNYHFPTTGSYALFASIYAEDGAYSFQRILFEAYSVQSEFPDSIACLMEHERDWATSFPEGEMALENDAGMNMLDDSEQYWQHYSLFIGTEDTLHMAMRVGDDGPVLGHSEIQPFRLSSGNRTGMRLVETTPSGDDVIEMTLLSSPVIPGVELTVDIMVTGVTFEDSSMTKVITADDFNELGECVIRFIRSAAAEPGTGACHYIRVSSYGN